MKKIFFSALAVISLAACMQDAVIEAPQGGAIAFENAFVGNATRADVIDNTNLTAFNVWGYVNSPDGTVFDGNVVSNPNGSWEYTGGTQYWAPDNDYVFAAVAPVSTNWALAMETVEDPARTLSFVNDGNTDLIYAQKEVRSVPAGDKNDAVALEFNHLLSKVKLAFTNGFPTNATVALSNIKMETPKNASINLAATEPAWTAADTQELTFTNVTLAATESAEVEEYFIVPAEAVITFDLAVIVGSETVYTGEKTAALPAAAFEMGHAYRLAAEINADVLNFDEIEFTVEGVNEWVPAGNESDKAANLIYQAKLGGVIDLTEDVVLDAPVVVPAGVNLVINLNGRSIKNTTQSEVFGEGEGIIAYGNLTINGEGTVEGSTMAVWARGNEGANVTINGGTYKGCAEGFAKGGRSVIYASSGNTINIYGGTFQALAADKTSYANKTEGVYAALNIADNNGFINVYGGTFVGQNPAAPGTEPKAWNEAHPNGFVAPNYKATEENGVWTVALDAVYTTAELQAAINAGQAHINLAPNTTFEGTVYMKNDVTIEGLEGATMHCVHLNGAKNVTLKNITFDAAGATMAYSLKGDASTAIRNANILTGNAEVNVKTHVARNITIDGCSFIGELKYGAAAMAFTDQGRKSGYSGNITVKGCTFNTKGVGYDIYGYYCGYENFVIEGNTFKSEFTGGGHIFLASYASATPIVVNNNNFERVASLADAMYTTSNSTHKVTTTSSGNTFAN